MSNNPVVNKTKLFILIIGSFILSDIVYILVLYNSGTMYNGGTRIFKSYTEIGVFLYLIAYFSLIYYLANKQFSLMIKYQKEKKAEFLEDAQKAFVRIQRILGFAILLYPFLNTIVHMVYVMSYTDIIDPEKYAYMQEYTTVTNISVLILSFTITILTLLPINLYAQYILEKMTVNIPVSEKHKPVPLNWKIGLNVTATILGIILIFSFSNIMLALVTAPLINDPANITSIFLEKNLFLGAYSIIIGVINYLLLRKSVTEPIMILSKASKEISKGNLSINIQNNTRDEIGQLSASFINMKLILNQLIDSVTKKINKIEEGDFSKLNENENLKGSWKELEIGIGKLVDMFVSPLNTIISYLDRISIGDMPKVIKDDYKGEFNKVKTSLNALILNTLNIIEKSKQVADGDLTASLKKRSEKDDMMQALSFMVEAIANMIEETRNSAQQLNGISGEIRNTARTVSAGASEQAASAEEVSASIEQISASINQNTENAKATQQIAKVVTDNINNIVAAVDAMNSAMQNIIEKISLINDIAERTDLLAINAAIEAARAGEFGKGFSVVAGEIRNLAENSLKAANIIQETSVNSMQEAKNSSKVLTDMLPNIAKTSQLVEEITAASIEQNSGVIQVSNAVNQFSDVTQQNSAIAEEMAANSDTLAQQSKKLLNIISIFKTHNFNKKETDIDSLKTYIKELEDELKKQLTQKTADSKSKVKTDQIHKKGYNLNISDDEFSSF